MVPFLPRATVRSGYIFSIPRDAKTRVTSSRSRVVPVDMATRCARDPPPLVTPFLSTPSRRLRVIVVFTISISHLIRYARATGIKYHSADSTSVFPLIPSSSCPSPAAGAGQRREGRRDEFKDICAMPPVMFTILQCDVNSETSGKAFSSLAIWMREFFLDGIITVRWIGTRLVRRERKRVVGNGRINFVLRLSKRE